MILVTGGTGFIGPHVVHALRARDQPVRALVRDPGGRSATTLAAWGAELVRGDMTDRDSLRRAVEGSETVVHLVAIRQGSGEQFRRVMEDGTRELVAWNLMHRVEARAAAAHTGPQLKAALLKAQSRINELPPKQCAYWKDKLADVLKAGKKFEVLQKNELGEECYSSPAISHGQLFIRGTDHLFCFGAGEKK